MTNNLLNLHLKICGRGQGVGFRVWTKKIAEGFSSLADDMTDAESAILEAKIASGVAENGDDYNALAGDIIESQIEGDIAEGFL